MIHCGFFNAVDGDRKYDAEQMGSIFDGIIQDGVYMTIGDHLSVKAGTDMNVIVGTGRAWFNHTWTINDSEEIIELDRSPVSEIISRIDAVVLEINKSDETRNNSFKVIKGIEAEEPEKPELIRSENINDYALAYITLKGGVTSITDSMIEVVVGTDETPYVTAPLKTISAETLLKQWESEIKNNIKQTGDDLLDFKNETILDCLTWYNNQKTTFDNWYKTVHTILTIDDTVAARKVIDAIGLIRGMDGYQIDHALLGRDNPYSDTDKPLSEMIQTSMPPTEYEEELPLYPGGTNPDIEIIPDEDNN